MESYSELPSSDGYAEAQSEGPQDIVDSSTEEILYTVNEVYFKDLQNPNLISKLYFRRVHEKDLVPEMLVVRKMDGIKVYSTIGDPDEFELFSRLHRKPSGRMVWFADPLDTLPEYRYYNDEDDPVVFLRNDAVRPKFHASEEDQFKPLDNFINITGSTQDRFRSVVTITFLKSLGVSPWSLSLTQDLESDGKLVHLTAVDTASTPLQHIFRLNAKEGKSDVLEGAYDGWHLNIHKEILSKGTKPRRGRYIEDYLFISQIILAIVILCEDVDARSWGDNYRIEEINFKVRDYVLDYVPDEKFIREESQSERISFQQVDNTGCLFEYELVRDKGESFLYSARIDEKPILLCHVRNLGKGSVLSTSISQVWFGESHGAVPEGAKYIPLKEFITASDNGEPGWTVKFYNPSGLIEVYTWSLSLKITDSEDGKKRIYRVDDQNPLVEHGFDFKLEKRGASALSTAYGKLKLYKRNLVKGQILKSWGEHMDKYRFLGQMLFAVVIICNDLEDLESSESDSNSNNGLFWKPSLDYINSDSD